jgi:hypothetical protein
MFVNSMIVYFPEHNLKESQKSDWLIYESHQKRWLGIIKICTTFCTTNEKGLVNI